VHSATVILEWHFNFKPNKIIWKIINPDAICISRSLMPNLKDNYFSLVRIRFWIYKLKLKCRILPSSSFTWHQFGCWAFVPAPDRRIGYCRPDRRE
jgi:hypothetical protein